MENLTECQFKDVLLSVLLELNGRRKYQDVSDIVIDRTPTQFHHRISSTLTELQTDGYALFQGIPFGEWEITSKGREFYDNGNWGYCKQKEFDRQSKATTTLSIHTGGGDIIGSAIGNNQSELRLTGINLASEPPIDAQQSINKPLPTVKSNGWFKKCCIWLINNIILVIILGVISSVIGYFITKGK